MTAPQTPDTTQDTLVEYQPMSLLRELYALTEGKKKKPLKKAAAAVYHRDYMKTRNKPYRKYEAQERAKD